MARSELQGVHLEHNASRQLRELPPERRRRVAHVLEEMVAVVELTSPEIHRDGLGRERLHFIAAGIWVEYSIDSATGLLTVHDLHDGDLAQAG
jgi:hypothetical protein